MTTVEAVAAFAQRDPSSLPMKLPAGVPDDYRPEWLTAACLLSGELPDCVTDAGLDHALATFARKRLAGGIDRDKMQQAVMQVLVDVARCGRAWQEAGAGPSAN